MVGVLLSIPHETEQSSQQRTIWSQKSTVLLWSNSSPDQLEWIRSGTRRTYSCVCSYSNSMYIKSIIYNMYLCFEVASAHWTDFPVPEMVWAWGWQREGLQVTEMNYNELFKKKKNSDQTKLDSTNCMHCWGICCSLLRRQMRAGKISRQKVILE